MAGLLVAVGFAAPLAVGLGGSSPPVGMTFKMLLVGTSIPYEPALPWLGTEDVDLSLGGEGFGMDGRDEAGTEPPSWFERAKRGSADTAGRAEVGLLATPCGNWGFGGKEGGRPGEKLRFAASRNEALVPVDDAGEKARPASATLRRSAISPSSRRPLRPTGSLPASRL